MQAPPAPSAGTPPTLDASTTASGAEEEYSWEDLKKHLKWSDARINAFLNRNENPNAYYYRFNAPGEEQKTGQWSEQEEERFFNKIARGIDYRWGIFSVEFPGRVGYQCSNHYRKLISEGRVRDPNYRVGSGGKLTFSRVPTAGASSSSSSSSSSGGEDAQLQQQAEYPLTIPTIHREGRQEQQDEKDDEEPRVTRSSAAAAKREDEKKRKRVQARKQEGAPEEEEDGNTGGDEAVLKRPKRGASSTSTSSSRSSSDTRRNKRQ